MNLPVHSSQGGMTLVEMLVVLVILAILIGLMVPATGRALERSRQKSCVSNLRQMGLALNACMQDNNGDLPSMRSMRASRSDDVPVLDTVLLPYVNDPNVFHCPSDNKGIWDASGCSYWWYEGVTLKADGSQNFTVIESVFLGTRDLSKIPLILDKEGFHSGACKINAYYADGHAGLLIDPSPQGP